MRYHLHKEKAIIRSRKTEPWEAAGYGFTVDNRSLFVCHYLLNEKYWAVYDFATGYVISTNAVRKTRSEAISALLDNKELWNAYLKFSEKTYGTTYGHMIDEMDDMRRNYKEQEDE